MSWTETEHGFLIQMCERGYRLKMTEASPEIIKVTHRFHRLSVYCETSSLWKQLLTEMESDGKRSEVNHPLEWIVCVAC